MDPFAAGTLRCPVKEWQHDWGRSGIAPSYGSAVPTRLAFRPAPVPSTSQSQVNRLVPTTKPCILSKTAYFGNKRNGRQACNQLYNSSTEQSTPQYCTTCSFAGMIVDNDCRCERPRRWSCSPAGHPSSKGSPRLHTPREFCDCYRSFLRPSRRHLRSVGGELLMRFVLDAGEG